MENKDIYREQFSQIYDQYIEKIYRFVYLKVSTKEVAEDLTSRVFLKGWESYAKNAESIGNQGAFLYQIARNTVIDYYREKGRSKVVSSELLPQAIDKKTDLHEKAMLSSDVLMVKSGIANLKQDYQDIIIWHYLDGLEVPEIALAMDKPAGTVRVMLHRGLKALKDELRGKIQEA
jgi:RNA polymerase sigma-70 factor (ECF subfamily)